MKKVICLLLAALLLMAAMTGCAEEGSAENTPSQETVQQPLVKTVRERVIEVTYEDFDMDAAADYLANNYDPEKAGCSAVRVLVDGKVYVGRNYDFYCSDSPALIVRNNSGKIRTIAIGNSPYSMPAWSENYTLSDDVLAILPAICCDVMSEAGIYAETNIRMAEEQFGCTGTNPGKERRCTQLFMQTMLSQYETIDEILAHIGDYDWFDLSALGFQQSFLLTDQNGRSVIVEFAANECRWQEAEYNANYYLNDEWYSSETLGCGELRIAKELAYKPFVRTQDDIFTMMEQGAYDQFYNGSADAAYALPEFYEDVGYDKNSAAADPEGAIAATEALISRLKEYTWQERVENSTWESTFIVAANVTDKVLNVHYSEHYGIEFAVAFE